MRFILILELILILGKCEIRIFLQKDGHSGDYVVHTSILKKVSTKSWERKVVKPQKVNLSLMD